MQQGKILIRTAVLVGILAVLGASPALAGGNWSSAEAGDTVTTNTRLTEDLVTSDGPGLIIGADDITIDLNGYTIECTTTGEGYLGIDNSDGYDGITIKDGTIEGFDEAIHSVDGDDLVIRNLDVIGGYGPAATTGAIHILGGSDVRIQNSSLVVDTVWLGAHSIRLDSVEDVIIQNSDIEGGFIGISFFSVGGLGDPTTGRIQDCAVEGCTSYGILLASTDDASVKDSTVTDCSVGMQIGFNQYVTGVQVSGNHIYENVVGGMRVFYLSESKITDNTIEDNTFYGINLNMLTEECLVSGNVITGSGLRGLVLTNGANDNRITDNDVSDNGVEGITLFVGANTGNVITDNTATGNGVWDLYHNEVSTPNTWNDNTYDTASGDDID